MDEQERLALYERLHHITRSLVAPCFVEDIVHDVWIRAVEKELLSSAPFITFKHMVIDEIRKVRRRQEREAALPPNTPARVPSADKAEAREEVERLTKAAHLSVEQGRMLYRLFWCGETIAEVAAALMVSEDYVRETKKMALTVLRRVHAELDDG